MKFLVRRVTDSIEKPNEFMEFATIEKLMSFYEEVKYNLIIGKCYDITTDRYVPTITIYDDYIE